MNNLLAARLACALIGLLGPTAVQAQFEACNVSLHANLDLSVLSADNGNDCWGYVSPSGREYALMGLTDKVTVMEITDPGNPVIVGSIPHTGSLWGDIKVYDHYAYAVNESGGGMDVIDLGNVDTGSMTLVRRVTAGGLSRSHNLAINTDSGYLYLAGSNLNGGAPVVYSLSDPSNPVEVGRWTESSRAYHHDIHAVTYASGPYAGREIVFGASEGRGVDILDVTNKSGIFLMSRTPYPGVRYCHQGWTSGDRHYLYVDDELDDGTDPAPRTLIFDVSNLAAPVYRGFFGSGARATDHNLYWHDGFIYESNYKSGLRVFDAANPVAPVEVGYFDTYPENNTTGFNGTWSNYPYFPSGTVIVSDMDRGLFILDVSEALLGRLNFTYPQGQPQMIDSAGGSVMRVEIAGVGSTVHEQGTGMLHFDRGNGFDALALDSVGPGVYDAAFPPSVCGQEVFYYLSGETTAGALRADPCTAPETQFRAISASGSTALYTEDFESASGWTFGPDTASGGFWTIGDPLQTDAQTGVDHSPPPGVNCLYTAQNTINQIGSGDVDDGTVVATSPDFDLSGGDAFVTYYRWYYEQFLDDDPADGFLAEISNDGGAAWTTLESLATGAGGWEEVRVRVSEVIAPTGQMRLRFSATDGPIVGDFIEAAIDDLLIERLHCDPQDADLDDDGDADLADYAMLQACFTGAGPCACLPTLYDQAGQPACIASDLDLDGDVDGADHALFLAGQTGL